MTDKKLNATDEGKRTLRDTGPDVAVLNDGRRVITLSGIYRALGRPKRGTQRVIGVPSFMDAQYLKRFISKDLEGVITRIDYEDKKGRDQQSYDANVLP